MLILVINPGATSTKIAIFENENEIYRKGIDHPAASLAGYEKIIDQYDYRLGLVLDAIKEAGYTPDSFDAVCGRGGLLRHIPSGTYEVNENVLNDIKNPPYGEHASNLGALLARAVADMGRGKAYFADPVSVDELTDVARVTGFKGMQRESFFHALNHKSMARRAAQELGKKYEDLNLIVVHMGGGVSVAAHQRGRVVDVNNVKDEGAFSSDRAGNLPTNALINFCFSGKTKAEVKKILGSQAGYYSYLGTRDFREVEERAFDKNEAEAKLIFDAVVYQHCKDMGAMAAVMHFDVDAIVLTGGMAYSKRLCAAISDYMSKLAPILVLPGEEEMRSLALAALRVLNGEEARVY